MYKTLEEDLAEIYKKRGLTIQSIFYKKDTWTITAKRDKE